MCLVPFEIHIDGIYDVNNRTIIDFHLNVGHGPMDLYWHEGFE